MVLVLLKIIMFALLIIAPIIIGRQLTQAARGRSLAIAPVTPETETAEDSD